MILPGVVLLAAGVPDEHQRRVSALLYAGARSWLAGRTAAEFHDLCQPSGRSRIHLYVPAPLTPRDIAWVSIRRTHVMDERLVERGPLRYSCRARALVDAAGQLPPDQARAMIVGAVQDRRVRLDDVAHWVEARRPNGRRFLRATLAEAAAGTWSVPEADLALLLNRSRVLPEVWANPELRDPLGRRLTTPDLWLDDVGMAVMVHSRKFHADVVDWEATVDSDGDLSAARVVVVGVTPSALAREPEAVLRRVEHAYLMARSTGSRAPVTATPRYPPEPHVTRHVAHRGVITPRTAA